MLEGVVHAERGDRTSAVMGGVVIKRSVQDGTRSARSVTRRPARRATWLCERGAENERYANSQTGPNISLYRFWGGSPRRCKNAIAPTWMHPEESSFLGSGINLPD